MTDSLIRKIHDQANDISFSGVISVSYSGRTHEEAFGYRNRANETPNTTDTRFGIASGTKGFTALGIGALVEQGKLSLETTARSILGDRICNLHPEITIRQLLAHTSGMGDYYDEEDIDEKDDFVLSIPVQNLISPLDYIPLLEEKKQKFEPESKSSYSNSGYIALAAIIEIASNVSYQKFIEEQILSKAGMSRSGFFRSDALPENTALGYISEEEPLRTNLFHLPIQGGGDGGAYSTIADMGRFWKGLKAGEIVSDSVIESFLKPQNIVDKGMYGYGFWIDDKRDHIELVGHDAGVSFYSATSRTKEDGFTVISNTSTGVWSLAKSIKETIFQQNAPQDAGLAAS